MGTQVELAMEQSLEGPLGLRTDAWLLLSRLESQGKHPFTVLEVCFQQKFRQTIRT